jgi:ribosomal-protein-alanine N-acetyltransferase
VTLLRDATAADLDPLVALDAQIFESLAWSRASMAAELAGRDRIVVVAEDEEGICGYAVTIRLGDTTDLQRIAVSPGRRRTGVGSLLLQTVVDRCRVLGVHSLMLEVAADNEAALEFYAGHGFVEIARRLRYYADGRDAVVMSRTPC